MNRSIAYAARILTLVAVLAIGSSAGAYSVLTHEEIIDLAWNDSIRPLLLARFPGATPEQLREAHAYAYGGSAIQDMGYYPFGQALFSDLTHYIRTGDFVSWMLLNARSIYECAFAIGALSHYLGDSIGHSEAINPATAIAFPKLRKKYGDSVTYDESPHGHIRTEFAFDVGELENTDFAPPAYLRFIGFKVPPKFLEEAFRKTYGFDLHELVGKARPTLHSYRTSVRTFIPAFAQAEVVLHGGKFPAPSGDDAYQQFSDAVARTNYDRHWQHAYHGPGFGAHLLAVLVFIVPKIGAASDLAIKIPTPETQNLYLRSVNHTVDIFRKILRTLADPGAPLELANVDLDTGSHSPPGTYKREEQTYAELVERLTSAPGRVIPAKLKRDITEHCDSLPAGSKWHEEICTELPGIQQLEVSEQLQ